MLLQTINTNGQLSCNDYFKIYINRIYLFFHLPKTYKIFSNLMETTIMQSKKLYAYTYIFTIYFYIVIKVIYKLYTFYTCKHI